MDGSSGLHPDAAARGPSRRPRRAVYVRGCNEARRRRWRLDVGPADREGPIDYPYGL